MGGVQSTTISEDWNIINLLSEPEGMAIVPADKFEEYVCIYQEDKAEEARLQPLEARWADLPTQVQQISEPECMAIVPVDEEYVWIYQEDKAAEGPLQTLEARWADLPTQVQQISDTSSLSRSQFDPHHYDSKMTELLSSEGQDFFTTYDEVHYSFDTMGLSENLKRGIYGYGFDVPSAIQQKGIVPFSKGLDVIQQAQSGTGKTATFCCGVLARLDYDHVQCQALVLAPTRELVQHIERLMRELGDYLSVKVHACVGDRDQQILQNHAHVVIGTAGRVFEMLRRKSLRPDLIRMLVLDEADEILSRNLDQIHDIFEMLPSNLQVGMFSTTMTPEVLKITRRFMTNPVRFLVKRDELALEDIKQFHVNMDEEDWKVEAVCDIHKHVEGEWLIIFVNSCQKADWLAREMRARGRIVSASHQDMDEATREVNFGEFRSGSTGILITTDLLARGIDLPHVSLVINYDLPTRPESYLHRIGRTGRFERRGLAVSFVTRDDERMFFDIQKFYNVVIEELEELPLDFSDLL